MSIDINIDSHDISDMDERLERAFDIRNGWGAEAVNDYNEIATVKELGFAFPHGSVQAVLQQQQETIAELNKAMNEIYKRNRDLERDLEKVTNALSSSARTLADIKIGGK